VSSFWKRHDDGLEGELRHNRPEPRDDFVASVTERVRPRRKSYRGARVGIAVALSITMIAVMAPIGAAGSAGTAAINLVSAASHVLTPTAKSSASKATSPASAQYKPKKKKHKKPPKRHVKKHGTAGVRAHRGPRFTG
jgi:hypothetical protein